MIRKRYCLVLLSVLLTTQVQADTTLGLTAEANFWNMSSSGSFSDTTSSLQQSFDLGTVQVGVLSLALEHPIPLLPNVKIRTSNLSAEDSKTLTSTFHYGGVDYPFNTNVNVDFSVQSTDLIFYYELFDNDTVSFDLGLNMKFLDGDIRLKESGGYISSKGYFDGYVPMVYGAAQVGIPATRLYFYGDFNFLSFGDHTLQDYLVGAAYGLLESPGVDVKLKGGYRRLSLELDDLDGFYADWDFDGLYFGIEADF
ncbi:MAG: TIGR04219 family outer membrane beta-barrel protein [Candidatus Thiodiazotropha sp.]